MRPIHVPRSRRIAMAFIALAVPATLSASTAMDRAKECMNEAVSEQEGCINAADGFWESFVCTAEYTVNVGACDAALIRELNPF